MGATTEEEKYYATHGAWTRDPMLFWMYDMANVVVGVTIMVCFFPYLVCQMGMSTIWEAVDKYTVRGVALGRYVTNTHLGPLLSRFTRNPLDGFMAVYAVWLGVVIPAYLVVEALNVRANGFSMPRAVLYNLFRIGPMYMNFMNVYVMCHKEAHLTPGSIFKGDIPVVSSVLFRWFNHWAGLFQGLVPGGFTYSHILGHHKYDNDYRDVVTTAYRPRDSFLSFLKYMPDWFYYACNATVALQFFRERRWGLFAKTLLCSVYHLVFVYFFFYLLPGRSLSFLFWYGAYPFFEANILLAIVNFVWHAFIDAREPANDYVNSTTIVNGANFTLQEEYHVVHHQYPGLHWSRHAEMYEKHKHEYFRKDMPASIFQNENVFVLFIYIVTRSYDKIADLFYDPDGAIGMPRDELVALLKTRLQCHGHDIALKTGRQHHAAKTQ